MADASIPTPQTPALQPFLTLHAPAGPDRTPPALSFRRKRRVELPWDEILGSSTTSGATSIGAIREYFEFSWGVGAIDAKSLAAVRAQPGARIKALQTAGRDAAGKPVPLKMYRADLSADPEASAPTIDAGLVVQHGASGRWYLLVPREDEALGDADLATPQAYAALWQDKVDGVELVFGSAAEADQGVTGFSEVDLRPRVIHRAFNELLIHKNFVDTVSASAADATTKAVEKITSTTLDVDELQRLQEKSFQLQIQAYEAQRRLDRLVSQSADLGYYLFLEAKEFTFPGGSKTKVEPGQIYTQFRRTAKWVTSQTRNVTRTSGWWIFKSSKTVKVAYSDVHAQVVTDYSRVDTSRDPLVEAVAARRAAGQSVFVFEQGPGGFVTSDGVPLRDVMAQCDRNENFRRSCVVMLPVYEVSLTGERALSKYGVFERPLPGIAPSALPQFSLVETLSYRTAWAESQLGELVSTINLAPGEERTVVMTRSFEQESSVTRSSTSIFDLNRSDSTDLASEMENQARQEREAGTSMNASVSGRGSYGLFSAEASASAASTSSLKSFSQSISKVAKKAAQSINQQNREEVSTSSMVKTTVSNKNETQATLRNINQGRTLNLLFHRVNNRFRGGIYLDDLQFEVVPGAEIIGGSGVYESLVFTLDELPLLLEQFAQTRLPFDVGGSTPQQFIGKVVASLKALLEKEYLGAGASAPAAGSGAGALAAAPARVDARSRAAVPASDAAGMPDAASVARLQLASAPVRVMAPATRASASTRSGKAPRLAAPAPLDAELSAFVERLRGATVDRDTPILVDELILASGGLYLDAAVGVQASTEPYSEAMRSQEVRLRDAEVEKLLAEAAWQRAQAGSAPALQGNTIAAMLPDAEAKSLRLQTRQPLAPGGWSLLLDGAPKATARCEGEDQRIIEFSWRRAQGWLNDEALASRIVLQNAANGARIGVAA